MEPTTKRQPLVRPWFLMATLIVAIGVPVLFVGAATYSRRNDWKGQVKRDLVRVRREATDFLVAGATAIGPLKSGKGSCVDSVGPPSTAARTATVPGPRAELIARLKSEATKLGWVRQVQTYGAPRQPAPGLVYQRPGKPDGDLLTIVVSREGPGRTVTWRVDGPMPTC